MNKSLACNQCGRNVCASDNPFFITNRGKIANHKTKAKLSESKRTGKRLALEPFKLVFTEIIDTISGLLGSIRIELKAVCKIDIGLINSTSMSSIYIRPYQEEEENVS